MEPTGDPEARIRDLERPLAEQASATEMGSTAPIPPPPYAPPPTAPYQAPSYPQYGSPYYAPPQQVVHKRNQPALWLIPLIVGVVVAAGIVGVVVHFVFLLDRSSSEVSGGGGSVAVPTVPSLPALPSMPSMPSLPSIPGPTEIGSSDEVQTVEAGGSLSIGGVDKKQTVICNQGTVSISGMNNTIDVQGSCAAVTVSGMDNTITVESADTIGASGFDNKVTYRSGDPQTSQSGTGNVIERG